MATARQSWPAARTKRTGNRATPKSPAGKILRRLLVERERAEGAELVLT
jgi:hypothetical protein